MMFDETLQEAPYNAAYCQAAPQQKFLNAVSTYANRTRRHALLSVSYASKANLGRRAHRTN